MVEEWALNGLSERREVPDSHHRPITLFGQVVSHARFTSILRLIPLRTSSTPFESPKTGLTDHLERWISTGKQKPTSDGWVLTE